MIMSGVIGGIPPSQILGELARQINPLWCITTSNHMSQAERDAILRTQQLQQLGGIQQGLQIVPSGYDLQQGLQAPYTPLHPWETDLRKKRLARIRRGLRWMLFKERIRQAACVGFTIFLFWGLCGRPWL